MARNDNEEPDVSLSNVPQRILDMHGFWQLHDIGWPFHSGWQTYSRTAKHCKGAQNRAAEIICI
jgi:hypothetical protein